MSERYIELYEHITGEKFNRAETQCPCECDGEKTIAARIEKNVKEYLASRK